MLPCPAKQTEHDGARDDIARASEQEAKGEASGCAGNGRGSDLVIQERIQRRR